MAELSQQSADSQQQSMWYESSRLTSEPLLENVKF